MTRKERQIEEIKREITRLEERLAKLQELPDYDEEEMLSDMPGFPSMKRIINCLYRTDIVTLGDLLNSNEMVIRKIRNMGEKSVQMVLDWMEENGYKFYSQP